MKKNTIDISQEISNAKIKAKNKIQLYNSVISICLYHLSLLRKNIVISGFKSTDDEICFFKVTKQEALHNLIYHFELKTFEIQFPNGNNESQESYIRAKMKKIDRFFNLNMEFKQYVYAYPYV